MKKWSLILLLVAVLILAGCTQRRFTLQEIKAFCDPYPVESYDLSTGQIQCAGEVTAEEQESEPVGEFFLPPAAYADMAEQMEEGNLPASEPVMSSESNPVDQPPESMALLSEGMGPTAFSITGAPGTVDSERVLRAQGADEYGNVFKNTIKLGTEMMLAEPGSVLVGPDFDDPEMVNSTPSMDWISPITQDTLRDPEEEYFNAAEGEFLWFTGATVRADVAGYSIFLEGKPGHNWFLIIRGLFPDGKQDSDRNSQVRFTEYVPGHAQAMLYPPGAYISEGNFLQVAELSHVAGRNCGKEGCSGLSVFFLDLNTGAWVVIHQPQIDTPWEFVDSNWR